MAYIVAYEKERLMNRLELDRIGIIADVLIKHDKIRYLDEIYKWWQSTLWYQQLVP